MEIADLTMEQYVIGAALAEQHAADIAMAVLRPDHFHDQPHVTIWQAFSDRYVAGLPLDKALVYADATKLGLDRLTAPEYLAHCMRSVADMSNVAAYVDRVRELKGLRDLVELGAQLSATQDTASLQSVADSATRRIEAAVGTPTDRLSFRDSSMEVLKQIEHRMNSGQHLTGLTTGLPALDKWTEGLHAKEVTVLAARTSQGKSCLALNIATETARYGGGVAFFSLEMGQDSLQLRMLSAISSVPMWKLRKGALNLEEWDCVRAAHQTLQDFPIHVYEDADLTLGTVRAIARTVPNLRLVVIDYLGLMAIDVARNSTLANALSETCKRIKGMASRLNVPVLLVHQLSRESAKADDGIPCLHHLRDSGGVENNADNVWFIYCPALDKVHDKPLDTADATIIVAKQRQGQRNIRVPVTWHAEMQRFETRTEWNEE